jgi:hypothetical protein
MEQRKLPPAQIQYPSGGGGGGGGGKSPFTGFGQILITVLISVGLAYFLIGFMAVPKADYNALAAKVNSHSTSVDTFNRAFNDPSDGVVPRLVALESNSGNTQIVRDIADLKTKSAPNLSGYATTSQLSDYIKESELEDWLADNGYVKAGTSSTGSTSGSSTTSGGLLLTFDKSNIYSTSSTTSPTDVTLTVKNTGSARNVSIIVQIEPSAAYLKANVHSSAGVAHPPCLKNSLTGLSTCTDGTVQSKTDLTNYVGKIIWILPDFWLESGASKSIYMNFDVQITGSDILTWTLGARSW